MKKIGIWIISAICIFALSTARADDGETIFKAQGCMSCHKKESTSKVNPSLINDRFNIIAYSETITIKTNIK